MAIDWRVRLYDAGAALYGFFTDHDVWRRANRRLVKHFPDGVHRVLDVGCGTGATVIAEARACPGAEILGVDISREMIVRAEAALAACEEDVTLRARVMVGDAAHLPFADRSFDVATGHSFLYLLPDRAEVLAEIVRVLRPGGRAIFMEPREGAFSPRALLTFGKDPRFLVSMTMWRIMSGYNTRFTAERLLGILEAAGLTPLATEEVLGGLGIVAVAERPKV